MAHDPRPAAVLPQLEAERFAGRRRAATVAESVFFAPLLLATGAIQILCLPKVRKWLLTLLILDIPLGSGTHLAYREDAALLGAIHGYDVSLALLLLTALYLGWLFGERAMLRPLRIRVPWPIAIYFLITVASLAVAQDHQLSLFQIFMTAEMLLLAVYIRSAVRSREEVAQIVRMLLAGAVIESLVILAMALSGHDFSFLRLAGLKTQIDFPGPKGGPTRVGGTIGSPNFASAYLATMATLALCVLQARALPHRRKLAMAAFGLSVAALVVTYSRGGWIEIALATALVVAGLWRQGGLSRKSIVLFLAGALAAGALLFIPNPISTRLLGDDAGSAHSRVPLMHLAYRMIEANPFLGVGANNFGAVMNSYAGPEFRYEWIYTVHNQFLLVCAETGIAGLAAYLWLLLSIVVRAVRLFAARDPLFSAVSLAIAASVCGLMSHMLFDIFSGRGMVEVLFLFAALTGVMAEILRTERLAPLLAPLAGAHKK